MAKDALGDRLASGGVALGAYSNDPEMIELMAYMGFDWVQLDQMFTGNDWSRMENLIRTSEAAGITPVPRLQSNPWVTGFDPRVAVDFTRAAGIGAKYILVSNSGKREIEQCAKVTHDWHRKVLTIHPFDSFDEWEPKINEVAQHTFVIPQPESENGLAELDETLDIPEVRMLFFAMTDASRTLTKSDKPNFYVQSLWDLVDHAVEKGKEKGVVIGANTSYAYSMEELHKRVIRLKEHGVRMIMIQGATFLFQLAVGGFLKDLRAELDQ
jgi:4-hydroxy-2-oxoheptanedioate aldolase